VSSPDGTSVNDHRGDLDGTIGASDSECGRRIKTMDHGWTRVLVAVPRWSSFVVNGLLL
jgi:hypothetical protein